MHVCLFKTIYVPVVYMAWYVQGTLEELGTGNLYFLGPERATSEASAIWAQKSPPTSRSGT
jgi:hypothetical protein